MLHVRDLSKSALRAGTAALPAKSGHNRVAVSYNTAGAITQGSIFAQGAQCVLGVSGVIRMLQVRDLSKSAQLGGSIP